MDIRSSFFHIRAFRLVAHFVDGPAIWTGYRRISRLLLLQEEPEPSWLRDRILKNAGFIILLVSSTGVEYLRMYNTTARLPGIPGGVIGEIVGKATQHYFGFTCGTLLLVLLCALGFSLFLQMSWLQLVERIGAFIESIYFLGKRIYTTREDRKIGQVATVKREETVKEEKAKATEAPPMRIEPQITDVPKSERAEKERQVVLFNDLHDSELPPLSLLDAVGAQQETVQCRNTGIHQPSDRKETVRFRCQRPGCGCLSRSGCHPL